MKVLLLALAVFAPVSVLGQAAVWGQCGGFGWSGPTTCAAGSTCTYSNPYYSQCLPGAGPTTTTTTTTTRPTTTTTTTTTTRPTTTTTTTTQNGGGVTVTVTSTSTIFSTINTCIATTTTTTKPVTTTTTTTTTTKPVTTTTTTTTTTTKPVSTTTTTTAAGGSFTPGPVPPTGNPFTGAKLYVNKLWTAEVANFVAADSTIACAQSELDNTPTAVWLDTIGAISNMTYHLQQAAIQGAGSPIAIIFVIYDLPGRDCHALASNGEIPAGDDAEYKNNYIAPIVSILKSNLQSNIRVVLIIEPDSLPNGATNLGTANCTQAVITGYQNDIAYAMAQLTMGNVWQYMDMGHGGWLGWPTPGLANIGPIVTATVNMAKSLNSNFAFRGFISNTANYDPWNAAVRPATDPTATWGSCNNYGSLNPPSGSFAECYDYNAAIDEFIFQTEIIGPTFTALGLPANWLFDSSRSGQPGIRLNWGSWCNIKGAGMGPRPSASPDSTDPNLDAFVWIKPPGESDGNSAPTATHPAVDGFCDCTTSNGVDSLCPAPVAGQPFQAHFSMMVHNANPPLGTC